MQAFLRAVETERSQIIERLLLDRLFELWLDEALLIPRYLPEQFVDVVSFFEWSWRWPSTQHVDRQKEAAGQQTELANHTTNLAREYARQGLDWETELQQRAREIALMRELGLSLAQASPQPVDPVDPEDANEEDETANAQ